MSKVLFPDDVLADYVIQVNLVFRKGVINRLGSFNIWGKGGTFGKADQLLKFCGAPKCLGTFTDDFSLTQQELDEVGEEDADDPEKWPFSAKRRYVGWFTNPVICSFCGSLGIRQELPDSYGFNMTIDKIAERLVELFLALDSNCDLFMVRMKDHNLFQKARSEIRDSHSIDFDNYVKKLKLARDRDSVFYPLKRIIKDTAAGAGLTGRFKALLGA